MGRSVVSHSMAVSFRCRHGRPDIEKARARGPRLNESIRPERTVDINYSSQSAMKQLESGWRKLRKRDENTGFHVAQYAFATRQTRSPSSSLVGTEPSLLCRQRTLTAWSFIARSPPP